MWAELSEARLIPSLAQTRHKHTNKLPRQHSAISSWRWRPPAPGQPAARPADTFSPVSEGSAAQKHRGNTRSHRPRSLTPPLPPGPVTSRAGAAGTEPGAGVSRRGMSSAAIQPVGTAGAREEPRRDGGRPPPPEHGKSETGMLKFPSFLFFFS